MTGKEYVVNEKVFKAIINLNELAKKLRKERIKKGAINFEKQEQKFLLDPKKNPIAIVFKEIKRFSQTN